MSLFCSKLYNSFLFHSKVNASILTVACLTPCDLCPNTTLTSSLTSLPLCSLCFNNTGLLDVSGTCQTGFYLRTCTQAVPSAWSTFPPDTFMANFFMFFQALLKCNFSVKSSLTPLFKILILFYIFFDYPLTYCTIYIICLLFIVCFRLLKCKLHKGRDLCSFEQYPAYGGFVK